MSSVLPASQGQNLLVIPILNILQNSSEPISEHQLITELKQQFDQLPVQTSTGSFALFQTHFLVMNALYQLQDSVLKEGFYLFISPLEIQLLPSTEAASTEIVESKVSQSLSEYYLDWANLENTDAADVDQLLAGFWQYYVADDQQLQAYQLLGLAPDVEWSEIQGAYRRLAAEQHPDRGGDAVQFMAIREAYEVLRRLRT
ncbi:DNA-J related domain-containing protein [Oceanicoccus sp. KOV_DT_Chl]|uniref:DNA-J related domain-containing protein n=1 Tax=Oceanicoccus sp. KOV_DT_Chl TaxID=1904639 RepID=UPI000C7A1C80|nr:DNA-J related domain-containing protein [Oceanicoccus sp. KOV_DT_Chl]